MIPSDSPQILASLNQPQEEPATQAVSTATQPPTIPHFSPTLTVTPFTPQEGPTQIFDEFLPDVLTRQGAFRNPSA